MTARTSKPRRKRRKPKAPPPLPVPSRLAVVLLRVFTGAFFLDAVEFKLLSGPNSIGENFARFRDVDLPQILAPGIREPAEVFGVRLDVYADFLRDVVVPNAGFFGGAVLAFEVLLGISLLLGLGVRLMAVLGALLMISFSLAKAEGGIYILSVGSANWPITAILLALSLMAAGRVWGLDARFQGRWPRWIS